MLCLALCTTRPQSREQPIDSRSQQDLVLPDSNDAEAGTPEPAGNPPSPVNVGLQLGNPVLPTTLWQRAGAPWAAVPEASVNEQRHIDGGKHEIGNPWQGSN